MEESIRTKVFLDRLKIALVFFYHKSFWVRRHKPFMLMLPLMIVVASALFFFRIGCNESVSILSLVIVLFLWGLSLYLRNRLSQTVFEKYRYKPTHLSSIYLGKTGMKEK